MFYGGTPVYVLSAIAAMMLAPGRVPPIVRGWSRFHRRCVRYLLGIAVHETGKRASGPALYAIRHESFFEALDLPFLLDNPAPFAKEELFDIPCWGRAARAFGVIPVARQQGARALREMVRAAQAMAAKGRPPVIFPEGTRIAHGTRAPLRSGFAALYKVLGLEVVPVAVDSGRLYKGFWKRRGTITIAFGAPIPAGLPRAEIEARVQVAINALNPPEDGTAVEAAEVEGAEGEAAGGVPGQIADPGRPILAARDRLRSPR